jgi:hypothetical protein
MPDWGRFFGITNAVEDAITEEDLFTGTKAGEDTATGFVFNFLVTTLLPLPFVTARVSRRAFAA